MSEYIKVNLNAVDCGKGFARAGDDDQGAFLNALGSELWVSCQGDRGFENQCCYISDKLDVGGIRLIKMLAGFVELREKEKTGEPHE